MKRPDCYTQSGRLLYHYNGSLIYIYYSGPRSQAASKTVTLSARRPRLLVLPKAAATLLSDFHYVTYGQQRSSSSVNAIRTGAPTRRAEATPTFLVRTSQRKLSCLQRIRRVPLGPLASPDAPERYSQLSRSGHYPVGKHNPAQLCDANLEHMKSEEDLIYRVLKNCIA